MKSICILIFKILELEYVSCISNTYDTNTIRYIYVRSKTDENGQLSLAHGAETKNAGKETLKQTK